MGPLTYFQLFDVTHKVDETGWKTELNSKMRINHIPRDDFVTFVEEDANNIPIAEKSFSIIINTSCEHFEQHEIDKMIDKSPANTLFVLQSTNYIEVDQHINCSASLNDFVNRYDKKLHNIKIYEMELEKYKRFMLLGVKS